MAQVPIGPVELLVIKFPGNQFKGEIAPALFDLVDNGTIRIIDLVFAIKDEDGTFDMVEIKDLEDRDIAAFERALSGGLPLLSEDDLLQVAATMEPNSAAAVLLFENTWATRFRDALLNANAELTFNIRIPYTVIEELLADQPKQIPAEAPATAPI